MQLYIDTSSSEIITLKIDDAVFVTDARQDKSQRLLPFIEDTLATKDKGLSDISGIEVFTGPGSFTWLRVGVSVAQSLGWALNVPVNEKNIHAQKFIEIKYS